MDIDPDYRSWLDEMTGKGSHYPQNLIDRFKFREFAKQFLQRNGSYSFFNYPLSDTLKYEPILIEKVFNVR